MSRTAWFDASAGVAGDMLAGALLDVGVPLDVMQAAVESVLPSAVSLDAGTVHRAGMRATKLEVRSLEEAPPHRHLSTIQAAIDASGLDPLLRADISRVFQLLGTAEADAHGVSIDDVHFHEVGAADSIADVVAVCAGLRWLGIDDVAFSALELGHGWTQGAHGRIPVPTPAAVRLTQGLLITSQFEGEMATPTGLALLAALGAQGPLPAMRLIASGAGAGTRDPQDHANVVRVLVGEGEAPQLLLEANIDDMDPRLWPGAIDAILRAGARDAWLTPIVMKKGRPALTLSVLCTAESRPTVEEAVLHTTTTIGLRVVEVEKVALDRGFAHVQVQGHDIAVKYAGRHGRIYNVSIEWDDVARTAQATARPERDVLAEAGAAAEMAGYVAGAPMP